MLHIYNSLTRKKEPLDPIEPGKVRMYVCGMTVYDYCHLGHAMSMVAFDVIARYIRSLGLELTYVRNITDIEDKIIKRANENGEEFRVLTRRFIDAMHEDERALGIEAPDQEPCATEYIEQMLQIIGTLVEKGFAYVGGNGDVYYDVSRFEGYGKLSGRRPDDLRAGARVEVDEAKNDPLDFVLWKSQKPGEPSWDSPWGRGRPGWHIECSAMAMESLGTQFDIHGGGIDLTFPHHENEIAQSEAATGEPFARIWIHNGHVRIDDEKMSKSLGNFFTVREILAQYPAEVVRYFLVSGHYRSPLNYSPAQMDNAGAALARLYTALRGVPIASTGPNPDYLRRFQRAMNDDFNTPEALAVLFDLARDINRAREASSSPEVGRLAATLRSLGGVLGLLQDDPEHHLQGDGEDLDRDAVETLIERRNAARAGKDWAEADRIRKQLDAAGVVLEDSGGGTSWRRKR